MPRILGFDPGFKGAMTLIDTERALLRCEPMPVLRIKRPGRNDKTVIDEDRLALIVRRWDPVVGWIEDVYSMPGEGHAGAFSFGEGKGILKGVLAGLGIPRRKASPAAWKRGLHVGNEGVLITAACNKLFPGCAKLLKSEGKREAAMITLWGALQDGVVVPRLTPSFELVE